MEQLIAVKKIKLNVTNIKSSLVSSNKTLEKFKGQKRSFLISQKKEEEFKDKEKKLETPLQSTISKVKSFVLQGPMSIFDKIKEFLGLILLGMLVNNLPTIIEKLKKVYTEIEKFFNNDFIKGLGQIFSSLGKFVVTVAKEISSFGSIQKSESEIKETEKILKDLNSQYDSEEKDLSKFYDELKKQNNQSGDQSGGQKGSGSSPGSLQPQSSTTQPSRPSRGRRNSSGESVPIQSSPQRLNAGGTVQPPTKDSEVKKSISKGNRSQSLQQGETGKQRRAKESVNYFASFNQAVKQQSENTEKDMSNVKLFEDMTTNFKEFSILMEKMKSSITPPVPPGPPGPDGFIQMDGKIYEAKGGEKPSGHLSSSFGWRRGRQHKGVDFAHPQANIPVSILQPGTASVGYDAQGWGNYVTINHDNGAQTLYGHLSTVKIRSGQKITAGTVIGNQGSTGRSTGPHVHFEYRPGGPGTPLVNGRDVADSYFRFGGDIKVTEIQKATSGKMTIEQILDIAKSAGFKGKNAEIAAAVAMAESGGDPTTDTVKSGTDPQMKNEYSIGLWQINWKAHKDGTLKKLGITNPDMLRNPTINARAALIISGGSNFNPWSVYSKNGRYKNYLPAAEKANKKKSAEGGPGSETNKSIRPVNKSYNKLSSSSSYASDSTSMFVIARQVVEKPVVVPMPIPMKTAASPSSDNNQNISLSDLWTV
jgi:murein DD-endopeptidase MepM/ murein hydrolase activator NlpD